jgi:catechol 2,3-dioxygenase-like lactoylglutathione lyase family enzyme
MLRRIDRILLRVPHLEPAVRYYTDVMGLKLIRRDKRVASFELPDCKTEIVLHADDDLPTNAAYDLVDDVRDLYQRREALKLTFLSSPAPSARGYRATVRDPFGNVLLILDRSTDSSSAVEDAKSPGALFAGVEERVSVNRDLLVKLYEKVGRTADDLPYTPHFESLYTGYIEPLNDPKPTRSEVWRHLLNLRKKKGILPKLGKARSAAPELTDEQRATLETLLGEDIGRRDRLPYTERFHEIVDKFNATLPRPLSPHLVWRAVATLAK